MILGWHDLDTITFCMAKKPDSIKSDYMKNSVHSIFALYKDVESYKYKILIELF